MGDKVTREQLRDELASFSEDDKNMARLMIDAANAGINTDALAVAILEAIVAVDYESVTLANLSANKLEGTHNATVAAMDSFVDRKNYIMNEVPLHMRDNVKSHSRTVQRMKRLNMNQQSRRAGKPQRR